MGTPTVCWENGQKTMGSVPKRNFENPTGLEVESQGTRWEKSPGASFTKTSQPTSRRSQECDHHPREGGERGGRWMSRGCKWCRHDITVNQLFTLHHKRSAHGISPLIHHHHYVAELCATCEDPKGHWGKGKWSGQNKERSKEQTNSAGQISQQHTAPLFTHCRPPSWVIQNHWRTVRCSQLLTRAYKKSGIRAGGIPKEYAL